MRTSPAQSIAAVIVALEGVAIFVLAVMQIFAILAGDTAEMPSAIALLVLTLIMGAGVIAFAYGILRGENWGRSGGIVTQVLVVAIGLGAATGMYAHPLIGLAIALPGVVGFVMILLGARRAATTNDAGAEADD